jgi:hypothetical protein
MVRLTAGGEWKNVPCASGSGEGCEQFGRDYLSKSHSYTVISPDGRGAIVHAAPATLSECHGFVGKGTYSGASIPDSAIAASSSELFEDPRPLRNLDKQEVAIIQRSLQRLIPKKLDSIRNLRFVGTKLEGHDIVVIQRSYLDLASPDERAQFVFVIGAIEQDQFQALHWKKNMEDEDESVIGAIRLKSGREYLITTVSDPESHMYRIYGFREGRLVMVYSGGGSSC